MYSKDKYLKTPQNGTDVYSTNKGRGIKAISFCVIIIFLLAAVTWAVLISVNEIPQIKLIDLDNSVSSESERVVSCYYNIPDKEDISSALLPTNIHPHLCTHINVAFAQISNKEIVLEDYQIKTIKDVIKLKLHNPKLKVLLSVGGAGNNNGFSEMVVNHASRKIFIRSIKHILRNYTLDGIDLDWEFPALHNVDRELGKRERQHFSQLLREIRMEYLREKRNYLLTVATAAQQIIVDVSYDVDQINQYVDYVNIMTYDFHDFTQFTPFTGLNAPLYARESEHLYMATLNINYTVQMYLNKGLNETKIVVGIPTYGHSFSLVNSLNNNIGSPASGFGKLGELGYVYYPEICKFIQSNQITIVEESFAKVPYLQHGSEWVSFDTPKSVMEKAQFIKQHKLRGAMIYSLNADDYLGTCTKLSNSVKFPLSESVKSSLLL